MALKTQIHKDTLTLTLAGDYLTYDAPQETRALFSTLSKNKVKRVQIDCQSLQQWDSSLVVILYHLIQTSSKHDIKIDLKTLPPELQRLLTLSFKVNNKPERAHSNKENFFEAIGTWGLNTHASFVRGLNFCGAAFSSLGRFFRGKATMRAVDFWFAMQECGHKAILIVSLISMMVGLILAFVSAVQLKMFSAEIAVIGLKSQ